MTLIDTGIHDHDSSSNNKNDINVYQYLVLDSGPIIKRFYSSTTATATNKTNGSSSNINNFSHVKIWDIAKTIITVPAVMNEIRDVATRQYIQSLPFTIQLQEPTQSGIQRIIQFAKLTGDYHSLSHVDIQVLALLYDLEVQSCTSNGYTISHIRTSPKRKLGLGTIESLNHSTKTSNSNHGNATSDTTSTIENVSESAAPSSTSPPAATTTSQTTIIEENDYIVEVESDDDDDDKNDDYNDDDDDNDVQEENPVEAVETETNDCKELHHPSPPKSWASLLRPVNTTATTPHASTNLRSKDPTVMPSNTNNDILVVNNEDDNESTEGGQFSDASEDSNDDDDDDDNWSDHDDNEKRNDIEKKTEQLHLNRLKEDLQSDFPSLAAAALVPYDDDDDVCESQPAAIDSTTQSNLRQLKEEEERKKIQSLQPISKSGKLYNSFTKYKDLMKPTTKTTTTRTMKTKNETVTSITSASTNNISSNTEIEALSTPTPMNNDDMISSSRILGTGGGNNEPIDDFDDDGEGWITTTKDITKLKAAGALEPGRSVNDVDKQQKNINNNNKNAPMMCHRAACVTTDFAMQNVILQMNLELVSLDGIRVRKLKNWVTRCGACYTVYTNTDTKNIIGPLGKRLFCEKCGSDVMQRIAASVDGKTGRLRLHLSKKYQYNLRGTKFSLPKPGTANRFQGDLLLREDQLLMGAWNQKLKMISGGKTRDAAQSIFGRDIATNVGCYAQTVSVDDIRVGFGRRNPNAVKGRERRGKKKKTVNTACGLRRY